MLPRKNVIELFSTFVKLAEDYFKGWLTQPRLRQSMEICLQQMSALKTSENFWALYWHKQWQQQSSNLAKEHLIAYLQEACYWAAKQMTTRFSSVQYKFSDCFQMAIAQVDKVLQGFKPNQNSQLKNYASLTFKSIITNTLRQHWEADVCTDWALLRKISQKRLELSLKNAGLSPEEIERYRLAWICFKTLYIPTQATRTQQLSRPDSATWQAITDLYNNERRQQLNLSSADISPDILEGWLKQCAARIRSYLYPQTTSLNMPQFGQESGEVLDNLPSSDESLLNTIIDQERSQQRQDQQTQLNTILVAALTELDSEIQTILKLYYGENLTQQEIAHQMETKQYAISRRLTRGTQLLLKALAQWSKRNFSVSLTSDTLKEMSHVLQEWLSNYYQRENG